MARLRDAALSAAALMIVVAALPFIIAGFWACEAWRLVRGKT